MRALPSLAALALGAATAFIVACGGDGRIPAGDASSLKRALNEISTDYRAGNCDAAERAVAKAQNELLDLPNSVDADLRNRLQSGIRNLARRVPATCDQTQSQTQETQPETTSTETTTTETDSTDTDTDTDTTGTDTDTTGTETGTTGTSTGTTSTGTTGTNTGTTGTDTGTGGTTSGGEPAP